MLNVVCFKWGDKYTPSYVNNLYAGVDKFLNADYKFTCITDNPSGLNPNIKIYPLWNEVSEIKDTKYIKKKLNCYRRLKLYDSKILEIFNYNLLVLDIDTIISGDITFLAELDKNAFYCCKSTGRNGYALNPSVTRIVDNKISKVWEEFKKDPLTVIKKSHKAGWTGSDQAVISYLLNDKVQCLGFDNGIISFRDEKHIFQKNTSKLPDSIKIISFYGDDEINEDLVLQYPWIENFWN